ncbi:MAG TPA: dTDP-4-dehydrorhamnose 3,5-epimerase [Myxococcota bacterium]
MTLRFIGSEIPGVVIVEPDVHFDERGFLLESYHAAKYREGSIDLDFVQDNHSSSVKGTLRGLHGQSLHPQGKLVRVLEGEIFDVVVDVRRGSPAYGKFVSAILSSENFRQLYAPPGLLHGFVVLSDIAQVAYKCTDFYHPQSAFSVRWNDPELAIPWPVSEPMLSPKDAEALLLSEQQDRLIDYVPAVR